MFHQAGWLTAGTWFNLCMDTEDWATLAGLADIKRSRSARIPGWQAPVVYAVGYCSGGDWIFPHINRPGGRHGLPAVMLAEIVGYSSGTYEFPLSVTQLTDAIRSLEPAEATTEVDHPNLQAWRAIAVEQPSDVTAVFIGNLDDEPVGPADRELRKQLTQPAA
jgi:hypothetical protein